MVKGTDVTGSDCGLFQGNSPTFARRNGRVTKNFCQHKGYIENVKYFIGPS